MCREDLEIDEPMYCTNCGVKITEDDELEVEACYKCIEEYDKQMMEERKHPDDNDKARRRRI